MSVVLIAASVVLPLVILLAVVYGREGTSKPREWTRGDPEEWKGVPRPPKMGSWIPFVGNALSMAGGDTFWADTKKKYGPAVRILAVGQERIFIQSSSLINHVYKASKSFEFPFIRQTIQVSGFGMTHDTSFSPSITQELYPAHHRGMQPGAIGVIIARYADLLEKGLEAMFSEHEGKEVDLVELVYATLYTASAKAYLSPSFPASETIRPFRKFDSLFPLLNLSALPSFARNPAVKARDQIIQDLIRWYRTTSQAERETMAPALTSSRDVAEKEGWPEWDWGCMLLGELWALEANAPFAGIWTITEILRRPEPLALLRDEITSVISTLTPPTLSTLLHLTQPEIVSSLPLLNACFQETLRFHTSSYSIRVVQHDIVLPPASCGNGVGYLVRKGEEVVCATRDVHLSEEEWGGDSRVWNYERFVSGGKGKGYMYPFGGGVSMCEGRHFASAEILTFIAAFITLANVDIVQDTVKWDLQRIGLGLLQPKGKLKVRIGRRAVDGVL